MNGKVIASAFLILGMMGCTGINYNLPLDGTTELHGHRGARGLRPENILSSFEVGFDLGMTRVELDVVLTADDQLIIHHNTNTNPTLCRTLAGERIRIRPIRTMTVEELKQLDCGSKRNRRFPEQQLTPEAKLSTLQEFFAFMAAYEAKSSRSTPTYFNIELKVPKEASVEEVEKTARVVVRVIAEAQVETRSIVQSFHTSILPRIKALSPAIATAALYRPSAAQKIQLILERDANSRELIEKSLQLGVDIIAPHYLYVTGEFVREAHKKKLKVIPWTVNEPKIMQILFEAGVDGIISDYPDRLIEAYRIHQSGSR